ncbi:MAG TPA: hypothetical protein VMM78_09020 [Thermomicrobiales bacterium]|nr:hypothetical protein [Thermomicrobiales bacterium]
MSVKDELHQLVNRLTDGDAEEALAYLRALAQNAVAPDAGYDVTTRRNTPRVMTGRAFFGSPGTSLEALAKQQGVKPVARFDDLLGDFWPEDESGDEFLATLKEWRSEGVAR